VPRSHKLASPFRYFNSSPEVIRLMVVLYVRFPLSLKGDAFWTEKVYPLTLPTNARTKCFR